MIATLYILAILMVSSWVFFGIENDKEGKAKMSAELAEKEQISRDIKARDERFFQRMSEDHKRMMEAFYG